MCLSTSLLVACKSWETNKTKKTTRKTYHFWTKTYPIWKAGGEGGCNESLNKKKRPRVVYKFPVPPWQIFHIVLQDTYLEGRKSRASRYLSRRSFPLCIKPTTSWYAMRPHKPIWYDMAAKLTECPRQDKKPSCLCVYENHKWTWRWHESFWSPLLLWSWEGLNAAKVKRSVSLLTKHRQAQSKQLAILVGIEIWSGQPTFLSIP